MPLLQIGASDARFAIALKIEHRCSFLPIDLGRGLLYLSYLKPRGSIMIFNP